MADGTDDRLRRFAALVQALPDVVYEYGFDPPGFHYVSPSATDLVGYTPEEHYADPDLGLKLVHPNDRHLLEAMSDDLSATAHMELRWIRRDGSVIWTEQRNVLTVDADGQPTGLIGVARDVTARRTAEAAARRSGRWLDALFAASREALHVLDRDGGLLRASRSFRDLLGTPPDVELAGAQAAAWDRRWRTAIPFDEANEFDARRAPVVETVFRRFDGTEMPVEVSTDVLDVDGEILLFCLARDLTGRRELERDRRAREREDADRRHTDALDRLTRELLEHPVTSPEPEVAGCEPSAATSVLVDAELRSVREELLAVHAGATIELDLQAPGIHATLAPADLRMVVRALVQNTVDAVGDRRPVLTIRSSLATQARPHAHASRRRAGRFVRVEVTDHGPGMSEEAMDRLFQPLCSTRPGHRGLGLAGVRNTAHQAGGMVDVESTAGSGCSVAVSLPIARPDPMEVRR